MPRQSQIVLTRPGRFDTGYGPVVEPGPGEAQVWIRHIGVCGTDIHAFYGRQPFFEYPRILGHELGGEVVSANCEQLKRGDLCAVEPYLNDPRSPASRWGKSNCCEGLQVLGVHCDGGMRALLTVPAEKVHVSRSLTTEQLALAEMLCIGRHAVTRAGIAAGEEALVLGAGPIGLGVIQFLLAEGARVIAADVSEERLAFCRDGLGVGRTLLVRPGQSIESRLRDLGGGELPVAVFDATGNAGSMASAFDLVAHGGRIVFVGLFLGEITFDDPNFHRREITLLSSRNALPRDFRDVIAAIEEGKVDTEPWITHRLRLKSVPNQFQRTIESPALRKAMIEAGE